MMNELVSLPLFFAAGAGIGIFYFGGLWWTLRMISRSRKPHLLTVGSYLLRSGFCLVGLIWIAKGGRWEHILSAFLGIMGARWFLIHRGKPDREQEKTVLEG